MRGGAVLGVPQGGPAPARLARPLGRRELLVRALEVRGAIPSLAAGEPDRPTAGELGVVARDGLDDIGLALAATGPARARRGRGRPVGERASRPRYPELLPQDVRARRPGAGAARAA